MPIKQVTINGQRIELHSIDGKVWCSRIADVIQLKRKRAEIEQQIKKLGTRIYSRRTPQNNYLGGDPTEWCDVHLKKGSHTFGIF